MCCLQVLFAQRKVDFLDDFGLHVQDLLAAQEEHKRIVQQAREEATKEAGAKIQEAKDNAAAANNKDEQGIKTVEGRGKAANGAASDNSQTYAAAANSASYGASHTSQYQQYGARYNSSYGSYGGGAGGGGGGGGYQGGYGGGGY